MKFKIRDTESEKVEDELEVWLEPAELPDTGKGVRVVVRNSEGVEHAIVWIKSNGDITRDWDDRLSVFGLRRHPDH